MILKMYRYKFYRCLYQLSSICSVRGVEVICWREGDGNGNLGVLGIMEVEIATEENGQSLCLEFNGSVHHDPGSLC